jgi:hypothetical protein
MAVPESAIVESSYSKFTTTRKGLASAEQKHQITMLILKFTHKIELNQYIIFI